jgi:hypothetical protein
MEKRILHCGQNFNRWKVMNKERLIPCRLSSRMQLQRRNQPGLGETIILFLIREVCITL